MELEESSPTLTLSNLGLEDMANYSCAAINSVGANSYGTMELHVSGYHSYSCFLN